MTWAQNALKSSINCAASGALKTQDPFRQGQCQGQEILKGAKLIVNLGVGHWGCLSSRGIVQGPTPEEEMVSCGKCFNSLDEQPGSQEQNPPQKRPRGQMERETPSCAWESWERLSEGCVWLRAWGCLGSSQVPVSLRPGKF